MEFLTSIYTNDPDGHIVELATVGPGFTVDGEVADLAKSLKLPLWLEKSRSEIEQVLRPISAPECMGCRGHLKGRLQSTRLGPCSRPA
jgi:hypothetical protein